MTIAIHQLTVREIGERLRSRQLTASDVVEYFLARIDQLQPVFNAFIHVDGERAMDWARDVDRVVARGGDPGALAGVPMGVKELQPVQGWPFAMGSTLHAGRIGRASCRERVLPTV